MTEQPQNPAAQRYKAVVADLTAAADELRERDRVRAKELERKLVDLDAVMIRAGDRAVLSLLAAHIAWDNALNALWQESWMTLRPRPGSDLPVDPERLGECDVEVERAAAELDQAVRRRFWRL